MLRMVLVKMHDELTGGIHGPVKHMNILTFIACCSADLCWVVALRITTVFSYKQQ